MPIDESKQILHQRPAEDSRQAVYTTKIEDFVNWGRKNSLWPMQMGLPVAQSS